MAFTSVQKAKADLLPTIAYWSDAYAALLGGAVYPEHYGPNRAAELRGVLWRSFSMWMGDWPAYLAPGAHGPSKWASWFNGGPAPKWDSDPAGYVAALEALYPVLSAERAAWYHIPEPAISQEYVDAVSAILEPLVVGAFVAAATVVAGYAVGPAAATAAAVVGESLASAAAAAAAAGAAAAAVDVIAGLTAATATAQKADRDVRAAVVDSFDVLDWRSGYRGGYGPDPAYSDDVAFRAAWGDAFTSWQMLGLAARVTDSTRLRYMIDQATRSKLLALGLKQMVQIGPPKPIAPSMVAVSDLTATTAPARPKARPALVIGGSALAAMGAAALAWKLT